MYLPRVVEGSGQSSGGDRSWRTPHAYMRPALMFWRPTSFNADGASIPYSAGSMDRDPGVGSLMRQVSIDQNVSALALNSHPFIAKQCKSVI